MNPEKKGFRAAGASCWDTSTIIVNHILGVEAICLDRLQNIASHRPPPDNEGLHYRSCTDPNKSVGTPGGGQLLERGKIT